MGTQFLFDKKENSLLGIYTVRKEQEISTTLKQLKLKDIDEVKSIQDKFYRQSKGVFEDRSYSDDVMKLFILFTLLFDMFNVMLQMAV